MPLTDTAIRNAKPAAKPYKLADGGGLFLLINPTGSRLWRLKYRIDGREKLLAIGAYPDVSLATARGRRDNARKTIAGGGDPSALKKQARKEANAAETNTFRIVSEEHLAKLTREGLAEVTLAKRRWLLSFAYPLLDDRDMGVNAGENVQQISGAKVQHRRQQEGPRYRGPSCLWSLIAARFRRAAARS